MYLGEEACEGGFNISYELSVWLQLWQSVLRRDCRVNASRFLASYSSGKQKYPIELGGKEVKMSIKNFSQLQQLGRAVLKVPIAPPNLEITIPSTNI